MPELGDVADPCQIMRVNLSPPHETLPGAWLTITPVVEADVGPRSADLPTVTTTVPGADWSECKTRMEILRSVTDREVRCTLAPIAPGASRTVALLADAPGAVDGTVTVHAEGPDLADADNSAPVKLAAPPALVLRTTGKPSLRKGVKVRVRAAQSGRARVTLRRGKLRVARTVSLRAFSERTVTIRATGAKLRSLRRHVPGRATITVRPPGGGKAVSVKTTLRR